MKEYDEEILEDEEENDIQYEVEDDEFIDIETAYLKEIHRFPLLTSSEEKDLAYKMSQGDVKAREKLINSNLRFVVSIASNYKNSGIPFLDLIESGNEGFIRAVDRFDISMGYKICTYAKPWIKKYITEYIRDNKSSIRVPKSVLDDIKKYNNKKEEQSLKLSREPNIKEMAKAMNLSEGSLESIEYQIYKQKILSLNSPIGEEQTDELMDFVSSDEKNPEEILIDLDLKHKLVDLLLNKCKLTSRQVEVLMLYFGLKDGCCRKEIEVAKICNITIARVRQVISKALFKIRNSKYTKEFAVYMYRPDEALENIESEYCEKIKINKL